MKTKTVLIQQSRMLGDLNLPRSRQFQKNNVQLLGTKLRVYNDCLNELYSRGNLFCCSTLIAVEIPRSSLSMLLSKLQHPLSIITSLVKDLNEFA